MNKTILLIGTLGLIAASAALANAAYVWKSGDITNVGWGTQVNWTLTDSSSWTDSGSGPGTTNSNMWGEIQITGAQGTVSQLEGWNLKLTLKSNTQLTVTTLVKLQANTGATKITIDKTSTLTIGNYSGSGNDGGDATVDNQGKLIVGLGHNQGGNGFVFTLGETGSVEIKRKDGDTSSSFTTKVKSLAATLSIGALTEYEQETINGQTVITRKLLTLGTGISLDSTSSSLAPTFTSGITGVDNLTKVDSKNSLNALGQYYVLTDTSGISVSYVIPEPSAFGLLAGLGAIALAVSRRRRRSH